MARSPGLAAAQQLQVPLGKGKLPSDKGLSEMLQKRFHLNFTIIVSFEGEGAKVLRWP